MEKIELKGSYQDFIGTYTSVCDSDFCRRIMDSFDYLHDIDGVFCNDHQFSNSNAGRFDWSIMLNVLEVFLDFPASKQFNQILAQCLNEYRQVFGHLKEYVFYSSEIKVQKTPAGGGYHVWHDENGTIQNCTRSLVWMLYLNDDYDGGETEYLYYKKRIQPTKGTLLIWPAGMTHTHRGGLVLNGTKYVMTGWFYLGQ